MMFTTHVKKHLSAYAHGELTTEEAERVAGHLQSCANCRAEFDRIKLGVRLAECLPSVSAPEKLWDGIESALIREAVISKQRGSQAPSHEPTRARSEKLFRSDNLSGAVGSWKPFGARLFGFPSRRAFAAACVVVAFALIAGGALLYLRASQPSWQVARLEGAPRIDSDQIGDRGRLGVGEWLETDAASRAEIAVANIGQVEVDPNTRVRLVATRATEHRLELARGTLHARIWAPPRLFFVNTPSAVAADLGCAYTLEVDDAGRGLLHVTAGYVALEDGARESVVPAGAACLTKPGAGPGTPFFEDAPDAYVAALARYDFAGDRAALDTLLDGARPRDTLTLWHLLSRANDTDRARVYERLAAIAPPPEGVTREGVLRLDRTMLDAWKDRLESDWTDESFPAVRRAWRKLFE